MQQQTDALVRKLQAQRGLTGVSTQFRSSTPQLFADIDRIKAYSLGVSQQDVTQTLGTYLGSLYVTNYNEFGRYWQVTLQAEDKFRDRVENINQLQVRNKWGQMVLLGTLVKPREIGGPVYVTRYNLYTAAPITGNVAPGVSSGDVIEEVNRHRRRHVADHHAVGVDRDHVHADPRRQHGDVRLRAGGGVRLSGAGRALRELVAAPGGHSGRAAVPVVLRQPACSSRTRTSISSCRSAWSCWSDWRARTRF